MKIPNCIWTSDNNVWEILKINNKYEVVQNGYVISTYKVDIHNFVTKVNNYKHKSIPKYIEKVLLDIIGRNPTIDTEYCRN